MIGLVSLWQMNGPTRLLAWWCECDCEIVRHVIHSPTRSVIPPSMPIPFAIPAQPRASPVIVPAHFHFHQAQQRVLEKTALWILFDFF